MNVGRTVRERARAELTRQIKDEARRQLARDGADRLSLRAVARELGMVSSALYRYFPSRDDLLTALIIDAYDAVGGAAEVAEGAAGGGGTGGADGSAAEVAAGGAGAVGAAAEAAGDLPDAGPRARWRAICRAVRAWARAHPHEYALIYGSPVPGYKAPEATIAPAGRVPLMLAGVLADSFASGSLRQPAAGPPLTALLAQQIQGVAAAIAPGLPEPVLARTLIAWTQLFGMISFELFGHLVGSVDPSDDFFDHAVEQMADFVGLPGNL